MSDDIELECNIGHVHRCCGIPMYPTESLVNEMKNSLNESQFKIYKQRVEEYW
ncbi:MAG: hypothetical protein J6P09_06635 [Methanobrevibacter sp.]|nr:hypothetical protein [Methanobrevibacter sp.]